MVLALVGFRKAMDFFPNVFSQQDLFWLDNLMPSSSDKKSDDDDENPDSVSDKVLPIFNFFLLKKIHFRALNPRDFSQFQNSGKWMLKAMM